MKRVYKFGPRVLLLSIRLVAVFFVTALTSCNTLLGGSYEVDPERFGQLTAGGTNSSNTGGTPSTDDCIPNTTQCVGSVLQTCGANQRWAVTQDCVTTALCQPSPGACLTTACQPGNRRCEGPILQICDENLTGWTDLQTCETAAHCNASSATCSTSPCAAGQLQCNGPVLERCRADRVGWDQVTPCETTALCEVTGADATQGTCHAPACAMDETRCEGAQFLRCNAGRDGWDTVRVCASAELCDVAAATGCNEPLCAANDVQCSGTDLQICNPARDGWDVLDVCLTAAHCSAGAVPECTDAPCIPGQFECNGATLRRCSDDQLGWTGVAACPSAALCDVEAESCLLPACAVGEYRCSGSLLRVCNADRTGFDDGPVCATNELCEASATQGTGACIAPTCDANEYNCAATGALEVCSTGRDAFEFLEQCPNSDQCNESAGDCVACTPGTEWQCDGATLEQCGASGWEFRSLCATDGLCNKGMTRCDPPICIAGQFSCDQGNLVSCNDDRNDYDLEADCDASEICDLAGRQCDVCNQSAPATCQSNELVRCASDGQSESRLPCGAGTCDAANSRCCVPNAFIGCGSGGALYCTSSGLGVMARSCNDGLGCTSDTCDGSLGCRNTPVDSNCTDADLCTLDTCAPSDGAANANGCVFESMSCGGGMCVDGVCQVPDAGAP